MLYLLVGVFSIYFTYSAYKNSKLLDNKKMAENFTTDIIILAFLFLFTFFTANEAWTIVLGLIFIIYLTLSINKYKDNLKVLNVKTGIRGTTYVLLPIVIIKLFFFDFSFIPSSSMRPLLKPGSVVILNKIGFNNLPFINNSFLNNQNIERGEVITFYSKLFKEVLIKRVIAKPGDTIVYDDKKQLFINGKKVEYKTTGNQVTYNDEDTGKQVVENEYSNGSYNILLDPNAIWFHKEIANNNDCKLTEKELTCKVPDDKYFVMGDNRDNSYDSRYFGFVDKSSLIGKYSKSF